VLVWSTTHRGEDKGRAAARASPTQRGLQLLSNCQAARHTVEARITTLHKSLDQGDYKDVLASAPAVTTAIASLGQDAEAKKTAADTALAQTKQQWFTLSAEVPKLIASIHSQLDMLSKKRNLPKGVTRASFESAKAKAASFDSMWTDATNTVAQEDNYASAVAKGQAVKDKASQIMQTLGLKPS
jgi:hypothetical protein